MPWLPSQSQSDGAISRAKGRRERRLERELVEAQRTGNRSGPPLTLFHPQLSTRLPDSVLQAGEVAAEPELTSPSEEYEEVLLEETTSSPAAPAPGPRLRPTPKKRPQTGKSSGSGSRGEARVPGPTPEDAATEVKSTISKPNIWFDESSQPSAEVVRTVGTLRIATMDGARRMHSLHWTPVKVSTMHRYASSIGRRSPPLGAAPLYQPVPSPRQHC